jgi:hypothetical protein
MYDFGAFAQLIVTMFCLMEHYRFDELAWLRRCSYLLAFLAFFSILAEMLQVRLSGPGPVPSTFLITIGLLSLGWTFGIVASLVAAGYREHRDWLRVVCFAIGAIWAFQFVAQVVVASHRHVSSF